MGLHKDTAMILSTRAFGESDKIVRFFAVNEGRLTGIAKGGKKSQKRFMNTLEPFNCVRIEFFEKASASMVRIENADLEESNNGLEVDLKKVCIASFFSEFVDRMTREKERNESLFNTLKTVITQTKRVELTYGDILYYELQMLDHLGYLPNFVHCVHCGIELAEVERLCFSREKGGTVCPACSRFVPHRRYPQGFIPQLASYSPDKGRSSEAFERLGREIMEDFVSYHLDVRLKSYRLLKKVAG
jgi:DNA repair protein RecO (recombination protein O)